MQQRSLSRLATTVLIALSLTACDKPSDTAASPTASAVASVATAAPVVEPSSGAAPVTSPTSAKPPITIDWSRIDSGVKPVDKTKFAYPFTLDSAPVKAYADLYHVDNATSRYNLTVGMAVNEVLNKVLDQIGTAYVSHELTAGNHSQFIIHTTKTVVPSEYTYVFAEPFAKGLSIPVQVINDGQKSANHPHANQSIPAASQASNHTSTYASMITP